MTSRGRVINVTPGRSIVMLDDGRVVMARNALNVRTPPRSIVLVALTASGWNVIGRQR